MLATLQKKSILAQALQRLIKFLILLSIPNLDCTCPPPPDSVTTSNLSSLFAPIEVTKTVFLVTHTIMQMHFLKTTILTQFYLTYQASQPLDAVRAKYDPGVVLEADDLSLHFTSCIAK